MSDKSIGTLAAINNNLITARFTGIVRQNEVAHVISGEHRIKSEVIRIQGLMAELQVYDTFHLTRPSLFLRLSHFW